MRSHATRLALAVLLLVAVALVAGAVARAVSSSDIAYYDGFQDLGGLDMTQTSNVEIDALGGLRMATNGTAVQTTWTSTTDFTTPAAPLGPTVGLSTLDASGDTLKLPSAAFGFRRAQADPVLEPAAALSVDGYSVGGMCVQRISGDGNKYYMWYAGVPEDRYAQRIYLATSTDGVTWTKEATPVLDLGAAGSFDSRQLSKPSVIYDAANTTAPFRMWYAAEDETGGGIGYATSLDGRTWTKVQEVLEPGLPGTADSYRAMQPCVVYDNGTYYMWYTADDSNNRRVAYATSVDGLVWDRGGVVFDVGTGNYSEGAFAPTVVKLGTETPDDPSDDGFHMLFTGNKIVSGTDIQSKIINADSDNGLDWTAGNIAFSASGSGTAFDGYNVSQPTILSDPTDTTHPHKMWYVGNNPDANGNYHDRIGLAYPKSASSVSQWNKYTGTAGDPYYESVLTLGTQSPAFDSMKVADLRPVAKFAPATGQYGFYTGVNARDFVSRIGVRESSDGLAWTTVGGGAALFGGDATGTYDDGGVACPAPVVDAGGGGWWVYHTALSATGVPSIGLHTVPAALTPTTASANAVLTGGSGFDASGQADPCAVLDGSTITVFYAGKSGSVWSIGRATTTTAAPATLSAGASILSPTPGTYDAGGLRKPVAEKLPSGAWRLFYTAIDANGVKRIAYATSADGTFWTKVGLVLSPSTDGYDFTEGGVEPSAATAVGTTGEDLYFTGVDRFGWTRVGKVTATGPGYLPSGSATYELDNVEPRDWRTIQWAPADPMPAGTSREIWVSYYPTLSGRWSSPFEVTNATNLPFLLTVQSMRWEVRMKSDVAASTPTLEQLSVDHAPIQFPTSATAVTLPIGPPEGRYVLAWGSMTVTADQPANSGVSVELKDEAGASVAGPAALKSGTATIDLATAAPFGGKLTAVLTFTGSGSETAIVKSLSAGYTSTDVPSGMTLTAAPSPMAYGKSSTLTGQLLSGTTPLGGQTVTIKQYAAGTGYTDVGTAITAADGSFSLQVKPTANTVYRAVWPGATIGASIYPPASATAAVQVMPKITVKVTKYNTRKGKYYLYKLGRTVYVKGAVTPNHAKLGDGVTTGKVTITAYKYSKRKWAKQKSVVKSLTSTSAYSWSWKPKARGTYRVQTSFPADTDHAAGKSPFRYVKVF